MGRRAMVLAAAVLAGNMQGGAGGDRLVGADGRDNISGVGGTDDIFGKGGQDRLFGDSGNDVYGGDRGDRLQAGMGRDGLFGQQGNDFVNAFDGQFNDSFDCGEGENDVAAVDGFIFSSDADDVSPSCESLYFGIPGEGPVA